MTKASRNARRKAEKARDKAGGLTNYTLFTPIALGEVDEKKLLGRSWNRFQVNDPNNPAIQQDERVETEGTEKEKVMNSLDFTKIKRRLYAYRQQLRHADGLDGDMGASQARKPEASNKASNPNPNSTNPIESAKFRIEVQIIGISLIRKMTLNRRVVIAIPNILRERWNKLRFVWI